MSNDAHPVFLPVGSSPARLFGFEAAEWLSRLAANLGLERSEGPLPGRGTVAANVDFGMDPAWLRWIVARPGTVLTSGGRAVLAHFPAGWEAGPAIAALTNGSGGEIEGLESVDADGAELTNAELRKREPPFVMRIEPGNERQVEKAAYDAAYKGVTDFLTLYLWRRPAFHLTRWAAESGLTPNMVTAAGAALCVIAFTLFWIGHYWLGMVAGFSFMVLDTVDGKLARCTGTSSRWGNIFDHGIDLVHPPFWWWAWAMGLAAFGTPLEPVYESMLLGAIIGGYVVQRVIEGVFMRRYKMHIHVWRRIDSRFRLVTARRNPNMFILLVALAFGRPDVGLELVALWTILSLIFHGFRLAQANARRDRGEPVVSWLA